MGVSWDALALAPGRLRCARRARKAV